MFTNAKELILASSRDNGHDLILRLQTIGALSRVMQCKKCENDMKLRFDGERYRWECNGYIHASKKKAVRCRFSKTLLASTFFSHSHVPMVDICLFVLFWVQNCTLKVIMNETRMSKKTAIDCSSFCREVVYDMMIDRQKGNMLGGKGKTVEIDESKFGKRKYHRDKRVEGQWVFELLERESGPSVLLPVKKRDRLSLLPIIKEWVKLETTIISDLWKAYDCLEDEGCIHLTVNHSINFKDPATGAITNRIESTWKTAKSTFGGSSHQKLITIMWNAIQCKKPTFLMKVGNFYKTVNKKVREKVSK